jgi:hypothetical protein
MDGPTAKVLLSELSEREDALWTRQAPSVGNRERLVGDCVGTGVVALDPSGYVAVCPASP